MGHAFDSQFKPHGLPTLHLLLSMRTFRKLIDYQGLPQDIAVGLFIRKVWKG
jgi:hypothetical protein